MATEALGTPGTKYGICANACEHRDCAEIRNIATSVCFWCGQEIGYGRLFYHKRDISHYVHETCEEQRKKGTS